MESGISPEYIQPFFPATGEKVTLKIKIENNENIRDVNLTVIENGNYFRVFMTNQYPYFSAVVIMPEKRVRYYFEIRYKDNSYVYYTLNGVQTTCPVWSQSFTVLSDLKTASWIPGGVCYQIFPDRFRNGNPDIGVKDGEFCSGGFASHTCKWDSEPEDFSVSGCEDFYNGDLKGIEMSIDHFKDLGITALYLNPIGTAETIHRYDCTDFFHVDPALGGDEGYAKLLETLHENGIKCITDISINHTGVNSPWFIKAQQDKNADNYYYMDENGQFTFWNGVSTLPQLNYSNKKLRSVIYGGKDSVIRKYLRPPFFQDGWRFDVADTVGRHGKEDNCHTIWKEVRQAVKEENSEAYIVGEDWDDASEYLQGDQWDATMNYLGSGRLLRRWMGEADRFQCEGWGHMPLKIKPYTGYEMAQALSDQLNRIPGQLIFQQFNLIDSHDCPRLHNNQKVFDFDAYEGVVTLLYMLPGIPSIYYGDEVGLDGKMGSVEKARYPMQWDKSRWNMGFYNLYKKLGQIRKNHQELFEKGTWSIPYKEENIMAFKRSYKNENIILLLNRNEIGKDIILDGEKVNLEKGKSKVIYKVKPGIKFQANSDGEGI